jgi:hypothetical protein
VKSACNAGLCRDRKMVWIFKLARMLDLADLRVS